MKFERIELERFGHFESLSLDLRGPSGLVVIHGPNEAGKTTLLRAIHGLLFGIDERSPYGFRYPYQAMAIHATLQDSAGQRLELVRRKKRKDALLGNLRSEVGEVALDEPRFLRYFAGVSPELYRAVFGFTHADLQQGAELLQVAGLAELLGGGALGGGAEVVRRVLGELRDEADALFKARGKNPPINRNLAALRDARAALRDATFPQPQYLALTQALKDARDTLARADIELARLRLRSARVHTLLTAFEDFHVHQRLLARLADPALATPLRPVDAERVRPLLADLHAREQRHQTLNDELERLERRAAQHPVDHALLAEAAAVERLVRRVEPVTARRRELPREHERLLREQAALRAEFTRLSGAPTHLSPETSPHNLSQQPASQSADSQPPAPSIAHNLSQQPASSSPPPARTASPAELEQVRLALARWRRAGQELQVLARGEADDEAELATLRVEATALADQAPDERGAALLAELESIQAAHAELERGEQDLLRIDTELEQALARLHPRPAAEALDRLPLPSFAAVQDMQARHLDGERERRDALDHLSQQTAELARVEAELAALLAGEALPDPASLAEARQRRDEAWQLIRQQLLARGNHNQRDLFGATDPTPARVTDRRTLARGFERALADADQLADQLRSCADRLAQKTALGHTAERARVALARAHERLTGLDAAERRASVAWISLWQPTGVQPGAPGPMLAWLGDAASLRDLAATRLRRALGLAPLRPVVRDFEARLRDHLSAPTTLAWPALVQQLRERERDAQTRRGRLESTLARSAALAAALARTRTARAFLERDLADADDELHRRTSALGLPRNLDPETAVERLEALTDLSERTASNTLQRTACEQALAALADFDAELAALLARLARDSPAGELPELQVESLSRALTDARAAASSHALAREQADDRRREQLRVAESLAESRREYDALLTRAAVGDEAALLNMSERTLLRDQHERSCAELDLRLARALGEGEARLAYESELRASRREALISEQDALTREITELDQRRISAALQKGRLEHEAQQLGGDRAARIGAELEVLKTELDEQIDRYLLVHLAERVLDRVTDRYARENQPALLQYTSELLARVTEGRHLRVVVQPETRSLATIDRSGQLRSPADLSSGTREQLFLALRLAYILDYCDRNEPLPVIMDDVLVNFDDARAAASLGALRDAARVTQVILLTCHRRWVDIARAVAPEARILELPAEAAPARLQRPAEA
ncbi:AAA family ATPase [Nannocystis sp.]|uniref:AAA family ATPase n=1 Tax=Nannocystis sp. TaxID=1962667 RepID=UPI0025ECFC82|nr:AAA family ATPase [Nannocystis sp.]MBK7824636.1 AAA family ATPase [Nannocystis sp.]